MKHLILFISFFLVLKCNGQLISGGSGIPLRQVSIYTDKADGEWINKLAGLLQHDLELTTGIKPAMIHQVTSGNNPIIVIGSIAKCDLLRELATKNQVDFSVITNHWESFLQQSIKNFKGHSVLVVTGSNPRGIGYGVMDLSRQMGITAWTTWTGNYPLPKPLYFISGKKNIEAPTIKYRGISIEHMSNLFPVLDSQSIREPPTIYYNKVFELMLRLKLNYFMSRGTANIPTDIKNIATEWNVILGVEGSLPGDVVKTWHVSNTEKTFVENKTDPDSSGHGIVYHFEKKDGTSYPGLNPISLQDEISILNNALQVHADKFWMVSLKNIYIHELPISFFSDYSWQPRKWNSKNIDQYYLNWASQEFGSSYAFETAGILRFHAGNATTLQPDKISITDLAASQPEWINIIEGQEKLVQRAAKLQTLMPAAKRSAFFRVVLFPVESLSNAYHFQYNMALAEKALAEKDPMATTYREKASAYKVQDAVLVRKYRELVTRIY